MLQQEHDNFGDVLAALADGHAKGLGCVDASNPMTLAIGWAVGDTLHTTKLRHVKMPWFNDVDKQSVTITQLKFTVEEIRRMVATPEGRRQLAEGRFDGRLKVA